MPIWVCGGDCFKGSYDRNLDRTVSLIMMYSGRVAWQQRSFRSPTESHHNISDSIPVYSTGRKMPTGSFYHTAGAMRNARDRSRQEE